LSIAKRKKSIIRKIRKSKRSHNSGSHREGQRFKGKKGKAHNINAWFFGK